MYVRKNNNRSKRFAVEIRIADALRERLKKGEGWARIRMKEDGQYLDICECIDGNYLVTFPPAEVHHALHKHFMGLDGVAEFIMDRGWKD